MSIKDVRLPIQYGPAYCLDYIAHYRGKGTDAERALDAQLSGEPRNHNYRLRGGELVPSFALYCRASIFSKLYPQPLTSILDIGCCRGYYALTNGRRPGCVTSVGIDVDEPSIQAAQKAKECLGAQVKNVNFHLAQLHEVAANPASFGGPFQTVMLVGTYHYLYWGSSKSTACYRDHHKILSLLEKVCTDRVIFSARLEINNLPHYLQPEANAAPEGKAYTTEGFLKAAREHFDVKRVGSLGKYHLLVMSKR